MRFFLQTTMLCALCLAAASCSTAGGTKPCDILVPLNPLPATSAFIVQNDRSFAVGVARHRGRFAQAGCGKP